MKKIRVDSFSQALKFMSALRQAGIHYCYWPSGGANTPRTSRPIIHQVAVQAQDEQAARQVLAHE